MQVPLCTHLGAWEESHLNAVVPSPLPPTPTPLIPTPLCLFSFSLCFSLLSVLGSMDLHALSPHFCSSSTSETIKAAQIMWLYRLWQSCWAPFSQWKEVKGSFPNFKCATPLAPSPNTCKLYKASCKHFRGNSSFLKDEGEKSEVVIPRAKVRWVRPVDLKGTSSLGSVHSLLTLEPFKDSMVQN